MSGLCYHGYHGYHGNVHSKRSAIYSSLTTITNPVTRVHTGRLVGLMRAQISHYNLLWYRRYKKIVHSMGAIIGATGEQITGEQIVGNIVSKLYLKYLLSCQRYKKLLLFWRNRTRLANAPTPEQIIMTYLRSHQTYQSACVNTL